MVDWRMWCTVADITVDDDGLVVTFSQGRRHRVAIEEANDGLVIRAVVARDLKVAVTADILRRAALRNRTSLLVGCRLHPLFGLVVQALAPTIGLSADEFLVTVRAVAAEADRLEAALTAKDVE